MAIFCGWLQFSCQQQVMSRNDVYFQVKLPLSPFGKAANLSPSFSPSAVNLLSTSSPPSPRYREDSASPHAFLASPLSASADEPRKRAPRALTGRHVKSGPGASPRTLAILRKKIEERVKLKELLGENSHLYFGALNKQKGGKHKPPRPSLASLTSLTVPPRFWFIRRSLLGVPK